MEFCDENATNAIWRMVKSFWAATIIENMDVCRGKFLKSLKKNDATWNLQ